MSFMKKTELPETQEVEEVDHITEFCPLPKIHGKRSLFGKHVIQFIYSMYKAGQAHAACLMHFSGSEWAYACVSFLCPP